MNYEMFGQDIIRSQTERSFISFNSLLNRELFVSSFTSGHAVDPAWIGKAPTIYLWKDHWRKVIEQKRYAQNECETDWGKQIEGGDAWSAHYYFNHYTLKCRTVRPEDYWYTLDHITDPQDYVFFLAGYKAGGINLLEEVSAIVSDEKPSRLLTEAEMQTWGVRVPSPITYKFIPEWSLTSGVAPIGFRNEYPMSIRTTPLPNFREDRIKYALYCKRFFEVITARFLMEGRFIRTLAQEQDYPALSTAYDYFLNRYGDPDDPNSYIQGLVNTVQSITLTYPQQNWSRTLNSSIPATLENGPLVEYSAKETGDRPLILTAREALIYEYKRAILYMKMNLDYLGGRVVELKDPTATIVQTPFLKDPSQSMFLALDFHATEKVGKPVFRNVAVNLASPTGQVQTVVVDPAISGGPEAKHYLQVPQLEAQRARTIDLVRGGVISPDEAKRWFNIPLPDGESKTALPLILGVAAAGAALAAFS